MYVYGANPSVSPDNTAGVFPWGRLSCKELCFHIVVVATDSSETIMFCPSVVYTCAGKCGDGMPALQGVLSMKSSSPLPSCLGPSMAETLTSREGHVIDHVLASGLRAGTQLLGRSSWRGKGSPRTLFGDQLQGDVSGALVATHLCVREVKRGPRGR